MFHTKNQLAWKCHNSFASGVEIASSIHISSSWVKIRLHTENQLAGLPGSALKASVGGGGWCGPTHYLVNPNLELRLSWAVTTCNLTITNYFFKAISLLTVTPFLYTKFQEI